MSYSEVWKDLVLDFTAAFNVQIPLLQIKTVGVVKFCIVECYYLNEKKKKFFLGMIENSVLENFLQLLFIAFWAMG